MPRPLKIRTRTPGFFARLPLVFHGVRFAKWMRLIGLYGKVMRELGRAGVALMKRHLLTGFMPPVRGGRMSRSGRARSVRLVSWLLVVFTVSFTAAMFGIVRPVFARISRPSLQGPSTGLVASTFVAAVAAAMVTQAAGVHAIFGAFVTGVVIPHDSALARTLARRLAPLTAVLLPAFFASTGVRTEIGLIRTLSDWLVVGLVVILEYLNDRQRPWAQAILRRAYQSADAKTAQRLLVDLAKRLETEHPSAAASVREGLDETLTVLTLNLSARLRRSLATTNAAESLLSRTRHVKRNVKRWRSGQMMLRWVAAGVLEAVKGFRRVKGYADMPMLVAALRARDRQLGLVSASEERQIA